MYKKLLCCLMLVLFSVAVFAGTTGKIRGTVTDRETNEPLPAANVVIEGTTMGAAADLNGEYIILNVPVGTFTVKATFVGYRDVSIANIKVNADLTSEVNFEMPSEAIEGEAVTIVAERPLINKNATNFIRTVHTEDLDNLPVRGVTAVVSQEAGVINKAGLHIRGGRRHENARYVDGVYTTSIRDGNDGLDIVDRAIEEITYQAGGMTAEYGFASSGVLGTVTKTGGRDFSFSAEIVSDDFWAFKDDDKGYRILGIDKLYSYGYDDYFLTLGGPIPGMNEDIRFYVAAQHSWRGSSATWFEGWQQDSLELARTWSLDSGTPWASTVADTLNLLANIPPGRIPGGGDIWNTVNANLVWDHKPFRVKIGGSFHDRTYQQRTNGDPLALYSVPTRGYKDNYDNRSAYVRLTHLVDPTLYYTLNLNYFYKAREYGDPIWWDDLRSPDDPLLNTAVVDTGLYKRFLHPLGIAFDAPDRVYRTYEKNNESYMGAKLDLTKQFGKRHEFRAGGEFNYYTLRRYYIATGGMLNALTNQAKANADPNVPDVPDYFAYRSFLRNYGYDIYGDKINSSQTYAANVAGEMVEFDGKDAPPHPIFAGGYIQDKIELKDMVLNAGVRFDYYKTGSDRLVDLRDIGVDRSGFISEDSFEEGEAFTYFSPRLGFSFPVTDRTVFHAQYGKFVQLTRLTDIFESWGYFSHSLLSAGYARQYPNPNLKPERQTQYEFGFAQQFGNNASLDITAFYKDTRDYVAMRTLIPVEGAPYEAPWINMNMDFATVKGLSATFRLRRTMRVTANANYTLSFAEGTGSQSGSHFNIAWAEDDPHFPQVIMPLDFDRRHKGTVDVDVRLLPEDGPTWLGGHPLGRIGLNMMFQFYSGSPYTRIEGGSGFSEVFGYTMGSPLEASNASRMPWFYQLDAKLDKTISVAGLDVNLYLWALNLLNTKSVTDVFQQTGTPDSDGHLESDDGKKRAATYPFPEDGTQAQREAEYQRWYQAILTNCGTWGWQAPRQVRFGLKIML
ncbi:MAG: hypothetical protein AMJ79_15570 [Phycisphaerae bacterium SM23_30]|nr:MAG: hypothetical protein AMJ79_15570 [Phycisphaerae bacterium SM23_30]